MKQKTRLENALKRYDGIKQRLEDAITLLELAEEMNDAATQKEGETELKDLAILAKQLQTESLLSGEADPNNAFLEVHAGAGGTESCDWASMLFRMYVRWAEQKGFGVEFLEETRGEEAGIKSASIKIKGDMAYGLLKTEGGVHRLVRISPFDSNAKRHTSFSSVFVYPEVDDNIEVEVKDEDLRVDTYRAGGAGGQHVNTTDSAVRLTHLPTGIVVACQQERSQHKNRDMAMKMLKARLFEYEMQQREAERNKLEDAKTEIGWGHQIRSYVLQPYQMVKDLRTGVETSDTSGVLDGDIDAFIQAALAAKLTGVGEE
jgi:peptide chain release factor 2